MALTRNITGPQTFTNEPLVKDQTKVRAVHIEELRDKAQRLVNDMDEHIGNYGVDHHKAVDDVKAGFMTPEQKHLLEEHTHDHIGPDGAAHGVATQERNGFMSATDKTAWDNHRGFGGTQEHPLVTEELAGFMSPEQKIMLEHINSTYVDRTMWDSNLFKIYQVTRSSPSFGLGDDGGTGNFTFTIDKGPLEAAAGRTLRVNNQLFPMSYSVNSYLYNWGTPFPVTGTICDDISGNRIQAGLRLAGAGTYHRSGRLTYTVTIAMIPANSIVGLA